MCLVGELERTKHVSINVFQCRNALWVKDRVRHHDAGEQGWILQGVVSEYKREEMDGPATKLGSVLISVHLWQ